MPLLLDRKNNNMPWNFSASVGVFSSGFEGQTHGSSGATAGVCYLELYQLGNFSLAL